jgi:hypothetical protein
MFFQGRRAPTKRSVKLARPAIRDHAARMGETAHDFALREETT